MFDHGDNATDRLFSVILSPNTAHGYCPPGPYNRVLVASWADDYCSSSAGVAPKSTWTHIAVVYRGGGGLDFYLNGAYDSSISFDSPLNTQRLTGRTQAIGGRDYYVWYTGLIDEVALFNRDLQADEIAAIFAAGEAGMCRPENLPPVADAGEDVSVERTAGLHVAPENSGKRYDRL